MSQSSLNSDNVSPLDSIDREIIQLLRLDGRISFTEVAKRLSLPETTARYRVQRLLQQEFVRVVGWPNPEKMGKPHFIIVWLDIENNQVDAVTEELARMDEVQFLAVVAAGRYNAIVDIYFAAHEELVAFFSKLRQIPGIRDYESHLVLKLLKAEYSYVFPNS
jgi:Lrp/AsnC family transcriptional regulator, regulator for asnA, asnC and gidA